MCAKGKILVNDFILPMIFKRVWTAKNTTIDFILAYKIYSY